MKPKKVKLEEAIKRLELSTYANSKAKRRGTKDEKQWLAWKEKHLSMLRGEK